MRRPIPLTRYLPLLLSIALLQGCAEETPATEERADTEGDETGLVEKEGSPEEGSPALDTTAIPYKTEEGGPARFAFRSGEIEMEYVGMLVGHRKVWFDSYGMRERTLDSAAPANPPIPLVPPHSMIVMTPDSYGVIDLRSGTGRFGANSSLDSYEEMWRSGTRPLGDIVLESSEAERLADTLLLGTWPCRVYRQEGNGMTRTMYVHGGVPIGEAVTFSGDVRTGYRVLPRSVRLGVPVDDSLFSLPKGYELKPFDQTP